jgi:hypothetical protein
MTAPPTPLCDLQLSRIYAEKLAIQETMTRYAHAVDSKDWKLYRTMFTPDAVIDYTAAGGIKGNVDEVVKFLAFYFQFFEITQHMISNFDIALSSSSGGHNENDVATMRAMFHNPVIMRLIPWPSPFFSVGGWYKAELIRTSDGWKLRHLSEDIAYNQVTTSIILFLGGIAAIIYVIMR